MKKRKKKSKVKDLCCSKPKKPNKSKPRRSKPRRSKSRLTKRK